MKCKNCGEEIIRPSDGTDWIHSRHLQHPSGYLNRYYSCHYYDSSFGDRVYAQPVIGGDVTIILTPDEFGCLAEILNRNHEYRGNGLKSLQDKVSKSVEEKIVDEAPSRRVRT